MGKRSSFDRIDRDFYPTPIEGVTPLFKHLGEKFKYAELCAGNGLLINHLQNIGGTCVFSCDIEPQRDDIFKIDALCVTPEMVNEADFIITNPPWDRKLLHPMIEHFSNMKPTWLLFDADWVHTKQAITYSDRLKSIVSVGRLKWIPDSKMTGKDNCAWHLFDGNNKSDTTFYMRQR